jgi:hypothetical protein
MKKIIVLVITFIFLLCQNILGNSNQITYIYEGSSGYNVVCRIENNIIFEGGYGYTKIIGRIENNLIFEGVSGYTKVLYRIENNYIFEGNQGYKLLGKIDGDKILEGLSSYKILYRIVRR